jgi:hypothetical protein
LEKWAGKWDRGGIEGREGWVGPLRRMVSNDRYHCDQVKKRNPMGYNPNKGVRKGVGSMKTFVLKMIGTMGIKEKRGIQWDRSQISVSSGNNLGLST